MPEISFIVPVYKVEEYIEECIASILKVKNIDFEILVIDDASPDRSIEIVKKLFGEDERLRIIRLPENRGLSAARNEGIREARGKYLSFIDSDDYIEPAALEYIYQCFIKNQEADVWCNDTLRPFKHGEKPEPILVPTSPPTTIKHYTGQNFFIQTLRNGNRIEATPHYIFKRTFILAHNLFFRASLLHEDTEHTPRFHYFAGKIIVTGVAFYYYRARKYSIRQLSFAIRILNLKKVIQYHTTFAAKSKNKVFAQQLHYYINRIILDILLNFNVPIAERQLFLRWSKPYLTMSYQNQLKILVYTFLVKYAYGLAVLLRKIELKWKN